MTTNYNIMTTNYNTNGLPYGISNVTEPAFIDVIRAVLRGCLFSFLLLANPDSFLTFAGAISK